MGIAKDESWAFFPQVPMAMGISSIFSHNCFGSLDMLLLKQELSVQV